MKLEPGKFYTYDELEAMGYKTLSEKRDAVTASSIMQGRSPLYCRACNILCYSAEEANKHVNTAECRERLGLPLADGITESGNKDVMDATRYAFPAFLRQGKWRQVDATLAQMTLNCPTCNRPMAEKGDEIGADPSADTSFVELVEAFLEVNHLASAQDKVERLQKKYRFVKREAPAEPDRED